MKTYQAVTEAVLQELREITGAAHVKTAPHILQSYSEDESGMLAQRQAEVVVFPGTAEEISRIMKLANRRRIPVTPRGAGTGVCGGAVPVYGGIVVSMERLNRILEVRENGLYLVAEAGVRTADIQAAARAKGLLYAGDPCSSDSCFIGGNLATNAGGNKAVRYGTTRQQVYAVEAVLPTGEITQFGSVLKKCSTGFCLEQLLIGSEGILGIITKVILKLVPLPPYRFDGLIIFSSLEQAVSLVPKLMQSAVNPTSVEFMDKKFVRRAVQYCRVPLPHWQDAYYVIVTLEAFCSEELARMTETLVALGETCGAVDMVKADERVWKVRRNCLESTRALSRESTSEDLVVPLLQIGNCLHTLMKKAATYSFEAFCLAHAGDGNLHFQLLRGDLPAAVWQAEVADFRKFAYPFVYRSGGRLSGEHGIGCKRVAYMEAYTDQVELAVMKKIKNALDPHGILNPGKVLREE